MGKKILLADDSNVAQRMGKEILSADEFEVATVSNGQAALKKLKDFTPDLILADIFMPGTDGYELCQFVKSDANLRSIPVVLLVGAMEPYDPEEGRKVKADGVITKPLQSSSLLTLVRKLLASAKPAAAHRAAPPVAAPEAAPAEKESTGSVAAWSASGAYASPAETAAPEPATAFGAASEEPAPSVALESVPEAALEVPQEIADPPMAAFEELLEPGEPPAEAASPAPVEAPGEAVIDGLAEAEPAGDSAGGIAFPFASQLSDEQPSETPFPIQFPAEEAETGQPVASDAEVTIGEASSEAAQEQQEERLSAMGFLSGSSEALEQTSADAGVLSVLSEVSQTETEPVAPEVEEDFAADAPAPAQIAWTVEPAEVTAEERKIFDEPAPDWGALTQLAEEEPAAPSGEPPGTASPAAASDVTLAAAVGYVPETEPAAEAHPATTEQRHEPEETTALSVTPAHVEQLVRQAVEEMMPQIVDRIARTVEIMLRREQD